MNIQADRNSVFFNSLSLLSKLCLFYRKNFPAHFEFTIRVLVNALGKLMTVPVGAKNAPPKDNTRIEMILEFFCVLAREPSLLCDFYRLYECKNAYVFSLQDLIAPMCLLVQTCLIYTVGAKE